VEAPPPLPVGLGTLLSPSLRGCLAGGAVAATYAGGGGRDGGGHLRARRSEPGGAAGAT